MKTVAALVSLAFVTIACGTSAPDNAAIGVDPDTEKSPSDPGARDGQRPPTTLGADASVDGAASADGATCGKGASSTQFRCAADGESREKCVSGAPAVETCSRGCLRGAASSDDVCMGTTTAWSCTGSYGTTKASNGDYYLTAFGCWKDAAGVLHGDAGDNCVPTCLAQAKSAGLCLPGDTGKQCEERVTWFTADAARFGCLARVKVTNPATGVSVVAVALDYGPSCSVVEDTVQKGVLDASGRVDRALFGSDQGVSDHSLVHVIEVDGATPLGPTTP